MSKTTKNAADVKNAAAKNNNATKNAAADVQKTNNAAADVKTYERMNAADIVALSAALIKEHGTMTAIRNGNVYADLCAKYGRDNVKDVIKNAASIRAEEIKRAAAVLESDVFTFDGITSAVFAAVRRSAGYTSLCAYAKRTYNGTDAEIAAAVIKDYYTAVDATGAPLCRVSYVSADACQILAVYERRALTFGNAVQILKSSFDGMKTAATNAATRQNGRDDKTATCNNVKTPRAVVAVYAAATDETGHVTTGQRRDNNADARVKTAAAAYIGHALPVGYIKVSTYNAAINGNESAADAVEEARNAAKDAAAAAGHAAAVED